MRLRSDALPPEPLRRPGDHSRSRPVNALQARGLGLRLAASSIEHRSPIGDMQSQRAHDQPSATTGGRLLGASVPAVVAQLVRRAISRAVAQQCRSRGLPYSMLGSLFGSAALRQSCAGKRYRLCVSGSRGIRRWAAGCSNGSTLLRVWEQCGGAVAHERIRGPRIRSTPKRRMLGQAGSSPVHV